MVYHTVLFEQHQNHSCYLENHYDKYTVMNDFSNEFYFHD